MCVVWPIWSLFCRPRLPALHGSGQLLQPDGLYQQPDLQRFRHPAQLCTGAKALWPAGRSAGHCPAGIPAVCTGCTGGLSCPALAAFSVETRIKLLLHRKSPAVPYGAAGKISGIRSGAARSRHPGYSGGG